jgi:outer membrane protein assembly factor BamB
MIRRARILLAAMLMAAGLAWSLQAQSPPLRKLYTQPVPPPQELLDRLNLKMAYRIYVPMDGRQDGLTTVQFSGRDLLVQTRSGMVALIDAETGATSWRQRVGRSYVAEHALAFNSREVYVINNVYLYALDRLTGAVNWSFRLPEGVASPPVADENMLYIASVTGLLTAYMLPRPDLIASAPAGAAGGKPLPALRAESRTSTAAVSPLTRSAHMASTVDEALVGPHPVRSWSELTTLRLELPMLITRDRLLVPTPNGTVLGMSKLLPVGTASTISYRFSTESAIRVPAAYYDGVAYVGGEDANLYALLTTGGRLLWRSTIGVPLIHRPAVTDEDIYLVSARQGMMRLDRATGQPLWRIPASSGVVEFNGAAERFLAANPKYVYALDASGRFLVLDRRRGITLSGFDSRDFVFPISNDVTDRVFLAANNGLIVCLHDREYVQAIRHHLREEEADSPVRLRLSDRITDDIGTKEIPLEEMLDRLAKRFPPLRFRIEVTAFRDANRDSPVQLPVKMAPVKDKQLGVVIKDILASIQCVYEIIGDTIVILPAPAPK